MLGSILVVAGTFPLCPNGKPPLEARVISVARTTAFEIYILRPYSLSSELEERVGERRPDFHIPAPMGTDDCARAPQVRVIRRCDTVAQIRLHSFDTRGRIGLE